MKLTLPIKFGIVSLIITLTGVLGLAFFTFQSSDELLQEQSLSRLADDVSREKEVLKNKLRILVEDVRFLSGSAATKGIVRSVRGGGFDVDENMTLNLWRSRLETLLATVLAQRTSYSQIRFIGKHDRGREIVRVERYENKIETVTKDALQEKGNRDYFKETILLKPKGIYFSDITLNREKGKIAYPPEPILRVGVPIYDATKTVFGIVVINVNFDLFASSLYDAPKHIFYFMANQRGDYLIHPERDKRLAFERNKQIRYFDDFPDLNALAKKPDTAKGRYLNSKIYPDLDAGIVLDRLYFDEWGIPDRFFVMGASARLTVFQKQSRILRNKIIGLVGVTALIMTLFTVLFARHITRPIRQLTNIADRIAGGEYVDVPVHSGDEIGQLSTSLGTMVSNLQSSRDDLLRLTGSLEDKVKEQTGELLEANKEIRDFAYIVSHDIRSPLVSIQGFAGVIREDMESLRSVVKKAHDIDDNDVSKINEILDESAPEAIGFIESSAGKIERLISAILELSRMGRREFKFGVIDARKTVLGCVDAIATMIDKNETEILISDLPLVYADALALEQIFGNLIDNAVKFIPSGRKGEIEIWAEGEENTTVFHVKDNGSGIASGDIPVIFDLFKRVGEQDTEGEGMGLSYVQALVRRLDGRIWCESELGKGTTFSFSIPDRIAHAGEPKHKKESNT